MKGLKCWRRVGGRNAWRERDNWVEGREHVRASRRACAVLFYLSIQDMVPAIRQLTCRSKAHKLAVCVLFCRNLFPLIFQEGFPAENIENNCANTRRRFWSHMHTHTSRQELLCLGREGWRGFTDGEGEGGEKGSLLPGKEMRC